MSSPDKQRLMHALLNFLEEELISSEHSPDVKEGLEVASQCLESAYKVRDCDPQVKASFALPGNLLQIFTAGCKVLEERNKPKEVSEEDRIKADELKSEGNEYMKQEKFQEAIDMYGKALQIDERNSVYFCNRAAAYSKVEQHDKALEDCMKALEIDPNYSKAYGRKGLAHSAMEQHYKAKECFERALELDPSNDSYKTNLKLAEEKVAELEQQQAATVGFGGGMDMGGGNFLQMLNNPALMSMATQMMSNPQMQQMFGNIMSSFGGGNEEAVEGQEPQGPQGPPGMPDMATLMEAGQRLAQQMQETNPDLVANLQNLRQPGPQEPGSGDQS